MPSATLLFSSAVSPLLLFCRLPRRLNLNSPLLHIPVPRRRSFAFASASMSSALRFLILDDPNDPLDFGAVAGATFLPLRRCAEKRKRAAARDVVEVRAVPPDFVEVRPDEVGCAEAADDVKAKAPSAKKGNLTSHIGKKSVKITGNSDNHLDKETFKIIENSTTHLDKKAIKIMTYNVWFNEDLELKIRMTALGNLIRHHSPDLICFQEVTPEIYLLFEKTDWWQGYKCSLSHEKAMVGAYYCMQMSKLPVKSFDCIPFSNSCMGRKLCIADVSIGDAIKLVLATSHLESPCPGPPTWDQYFSKERIAQANESLNRLVGFPNVIFCGDMNWDDKRDGPFPLPEGWIDAWVELKPGENGWTYDTKANVMLTGNNKVQKRLDRFVCKLSDFRVDSIEMIGKGPIPGVTYTKERKVRGVIRQWELPVFPSDHFGLLLIITY